MHSLICPSEPAHEASNLYSVSLSPSGPLISSESIIDEYYILFLNAIDNRLYGSVQLPSNACKLASVTTLGDEINERWLLTVR